MKTFFDSDVVLDVVLERQAIDSDLSDFEYAIQYFSALHSDADCILTRNPADFPHRAALPILAPVEFLTGESR